MSAPIIENDATASMAARRVTIAIPAANPTRAPRSMAGEGTARSAWLIGEARRQRPWHHHAVSTRPLTVEVTRFETESAAEVASEFLADDSIEAMVVGDPSIGFAVVVHRDDAPRASALLGVAGRPAAAAMADPALDPWDEPLPASSLWRRPGWVRLIGLLIVIGMALPLVVGLLRWIAR
jgi:hypothetical protein